MSTRMVVATQGDPVFVNTFFPPFLKALRGSEVEVVEITDLPNFNESRLRLARRVLGYYGVGGTARFAFRFASALAADSPENPTRLETIGEEMGVPVRARPTVNSDAYIGFLRENDVDILLSVAAPEIFRPKLLRSVPHVLNVHNGRLPKYRGMMPTFWAIREGDSEALVTLHRMGEELDAGYLLAEYPVLIREDDTVFDLSVRAKKVAGEKVGAFVRECAESGAVPEGEPIQIDEGSYYSFPTRRDVAGLRERGRRLL